MTFERYSMVSQGINEVLEDKCKKPRYQTPCSITQKWVCKKKEDGSLKISRCKNRKGMKSSKEKSSSCQCNPGEIFGWKSVELDQPELKSHKNFLKQNMK